MNAAGFDGSILSRGDNDYEEARRSTVWNARTPPRFPELIVEAASEEDVVRAVRLAREERMEVEVRSGGHSWAGNHVRDGGLLLDLSRLTEVTVDADAMSAIAAHPTAHRHNSLQPPAVRGAKAHWGAVHHPVEDVGTGLVHARIGFCAPTEIGFSTDGLNDPDVATIVCGYAGDDRHRVRHSPMVHVFGEDGDGVVLRSRFWLGAALRPYLPAPLAAPGALLINNRLVRRMTLPAELPRALALHCAEEYANLAALLPGQYGRFGSERA